MKSLTEGQKSRKLNKIDKLKKEMRYEKNKFGCYYDGRGLRYSIAELYFEVNDLKKTNRYLSWFDKTFPDDCKYPHFILGAAFTYYQLRKLDKCTRQLISINSDNTYILNLITKVDLESQDKLEFSQHNKKSWAVEQLPNFNKYITEEFQEWIKQLICQENYQKWYIRYVSILKLLEDLEVSDERTSLLNASYKCIDDWQKLYPSPPKESNDTP